MFENIVVFTKAEERHRAYLGNIIANGYTAASKPRDTPWRFPLALIHIATVRGYSTAAQIALELADQRAERVDMQDAYEHVRKIHRAAKAERMAAKLDQ